jgi:nucleoside-diphosphate-sugar epimerase
MDTIIIAGASGRLGTRIARSLIERGANVRALVRHETDSGSADELRKLGATIAKVDYYNGPQLTKACEGGSCVISALSGLEEVLIDAQSQLLAAALKTGVPRFIPSDYAVDFTKIPYGTNRNFDLRRKFHESLDAADIAPTSILCGMFTDLLIGPAPVILFKLKRVVYWENPDQLMDFTTIDNAAEFTAAAAMDPSTPRFLRVAGEEVSARGLARVASEVTGEEFKLFRGGGLGRLAALIKLMRLLTPKSDAVFPPWQGMQYLHNMFEGRVKLEPLDNARYSWIRWTPVRNVISARPS